MTAPIWMAAPPEVHSLLLSSGPGPGSLLAASQSWMTLSTEYAAVADELSALVAGVQAGSWEGPSAEQYAAAQVPYTAWLMQASAVSAATAAQHEIAAAAYTTALTAMPTLIELAANHAIHAVLVSTNFFGINTIPITLNETDYARMWIEAATTMSVYQAVSGAAVASAPDTTPAPQIVRAAAASDPAPPATDLLSQIDQLLFPPGFLENVAGATDLFNAIFPFNPFSSYPPGTTLSQALMAALKSFTDGAFVYGPQYFQIAAQDPSHAISILVLLGVQLITHRIVDIIQILYNFPALLTVALPLATAPLGAVGGLAGLAGLATLPAPALPTPAAPIPVAAQPQPAVALAPALSPDGLAPAPASPPAPAPAASPAAPAAPPPPPPPPGAEAAAYPYLVGGPGMGSGMSTQAKTQEPIYRGGTKAPAAAAAEVAAQPARVRRRRLAKARQVGRGYEYMDLEPNHPEPEDVTPYRHERATSAVASDRAAGALGFAGTEVESGHTQPAGLSMLAGDEFGGGPRMPMMPTTWKSDQSGEVGDARDDA